MERDASAETVLRALPWPVAGSVGFDPLRRYTLHHVTLLLLNAQPLCLLR